MNNFKIPKIRFMNFNDKWKYKILGEISNSIEYGLNASAKDFDGIHKYLRITDIDDSSRLFLTDKLSSPDVNFTEEDYENYKLQNNDLLFARTGASVGKTYLYRKTDGKVYYAGFLIRARLHDSYDGNFVFQQTLTDKYKRFIEIASQRSGQPGVNGKEYGEWKIGMTSYDEQSAIGSLFRTLDGLLASYKDNLANYQAFKTTMLSKMFPKAGQTVPEIRLDGFVGEWERNSLSEVCTINSGRDYKHLKYGDIPVYGTGGYMLSVNEKLCDEDAIGIGRKGTIDKPYLLLAPFWTVDTLFYVTCKVGYDLNYLFLIFQKVRWKKFDESTGVPSLSKKTIEKVVSKFPSFSEQQAIGAYFSNLDNLINSHQEKISQLETLKKKLLQDMFI